MKQRRKSMDNDKVMVELYHNNGLMPDWIYYQLNGKSAEENYRDIINKRSAIYREQIIKGKEKTELEKEIEKQAEKVIDKALDNIFKDFNL